MFQIVKNLSLPLNNFISFLNCIIGTSTKFMSYQNPNRYTTTAKQWKVTKPRDMVALEPEQALKTMCEV
jgi:hypothetical protein